ncbi:protein FAM185A [Argonauta hians]
MSVITTAIRRQSSNNNLDYCPQGITAIEMWGHETDPFGNIDVDVPFHTLIRPLNPIKYPEMNRVFVRLLVPVSEEESNKTSFNSNLSRWSEIYELNSTIEGDKVFVKGYIPKDIFGDSLPEMTCLIEIPIKFTVNVEAAGKSNVSIQYMEGNKIIVKSHYGKCLLKEIKAGEVDVYCVKGHIESSGVLQGNIRLKCQNEGIIKANRLQGQTIHCSIGGGIMDIQNIYADTCNLASSALAKLTIGSCHGDTMILMKEGNVNIKNVEGHFDGTIDEGNMEIGLTSTPKNVSVANHKGDIILGLNPSVTAKFELNAKEIKLDEQFSELSEKLEKKIVNEKHSDNPTVHMELQGSIGSNSQKYSQIKATANEGNLILKKHDWMSSLGFTLKTD